jgi:predicted transcriptional regulator
MAISNELSSEIAAALLSKENTPAELKQLREVVLQVHDALQEIEERTSRARRNVKIKAAKGGSEE